MNTFLILNISIKLLLKYIYFEFVESDEWFYLFFIITRINTINIIFINSNIIEITRDKMAATIRILSIKSSRACRNSLQNPVTFNGSLALVP